MGHTLVDVKGMASLLGTHCFVKVGILKLSCKWAVQLVVNVSALNDGVIDTQ